MEVLLRIIYYTSQYQYGLFRLYNYGEKWILDSSAEICGVYWVSPRILVQKNTTQAIF